MRYLRPDETGAEGEREFHALFTVAELLRNGITTFVEYGSQLLIQEALKEQCLKLGARGYLGPGYDSGRWVGDQHGRLKRVVNEPNGWREFAGALEWIARNDGAGGGLVKGILVPRELETCSLELLRATRRKGRRSDPPMATHAAYSIVEFYADGAREYPAARRIELLDELGMLRPTLNIGHGNLPSDSVRLDHPGARDLALIGAAKVSISHCPIDVIRRARVLDNWKSYSALGINVAHRLGHLSARHAPDHARRLVPRQDDEPRLQGGDGGGDVRRGDAGTARGRSVATTSAGSRPARGPTFSSST